MLQNRLHYAWMKSPLFWTVMMTLISLQAVAQERAAIRDATPNPAAKYSSGDIEASHSRVFIFVGKRGAGHEHAIEGRLQKGKLEMKPNAVAAEKVGELVFDMTSFDADTDLARKYVGLEGSIDASTRKAVNENMLAKGVLDVARFPTATFVAKKIEATGNNSKRGLPEYKIAGSFTLHGETKPIEFVADLENVNGWQHLRGSFSILQTDYGIKPFSKLLGAVGVTDKLDIYGDLFVAP